MTFETSLPRSAFLISRPDEEEHHDDRADDRGRDSDPG
jgi:hypothetical protein